MNSSTKIFLTVLLFVLIISGGMVYFATKSKNDTKKIADNTEQGQVAGASTQGDKNYSQDYILKLAKFMTEKGLVMYGAYWCSHCQDQKKLFGDALGSIDYVECDAKGPNANPDECVAQGIEGYPTWVYQGKKYSGYKSLSELAGIVKFTDSTDTQINQPADTEPAPTE